MLDINVLNSEQSVSNLYFMNKKDFKVKFYVKTCHILYYFQYGNFKYKQN